MLWLQRKRRKKLKRIRRKNNPFLQLCIRINWDLEGDCRHERYKTILLGIAVILLGIAVSTMNVFGWCGGGLGILIAFAGLFVKDE